MTQGAVGLDTLGILTAAAVQTERVRLGTSIVPAFTRHPLAIAGQALTLEDLAPGRLRLGIGTSHGASFAQPYGATFNRPLAISVGRGSRVRVKVVARLRGGKRAVRVRTSFGCA